MADQTIEIDLRRDLPKVRAQLEAILPNQGKCSYAAPCAVGAMIPEELRAGLDSLTCAQGFSNLKISILVGMGAVVIPKDQVDDAQGLQSAFDNLCSNFKAALARLEAKYLTEQAA